MLLTNAGQDMWRTQFKYHSNQQCTHGRVGDNVITLPVLQVYHGMTLYSATYLLIFFARQADFMGT